LAVTVDQNSQPTLLVPSALGAQTPWHPSGSQVLGASHPNVAVYDPVESQRVAIFEVGSHAPVFGTHVTHPCPSLHSLLQRMTCANAPCPSHTLATSPSQMICPYAHTVLPSEPESNEAPPVPVEARIADTRSAAHPDKNAAPSKK
jgi:hypothetical protein